jgi:mediator of replication checkpoint protein 1
MASSRESSPASEAGTSSPAQLTPSSKVKAMLAAFDNDLDDESVSGSARARLLSSIAKNSKPTKSAKIPEPVSEDIPQGKAHEDSEDDEEEEIVRPKGRMAARMLAEENTSGEDEPAADDARERVRKMLMAKSKSPEPTANTEDRDGSDEKDTPVASRKRKIRVPRRETPQSSPVRAPASPGLFVSPQPGTVAGSTSDASDSDELPENPGTNDRFLALVAKKREERLAREAELAKEKAKKAAERKRQSSLLEEDDQLDDSDDDVERRLTQQARPSRKASKRALEEMHRETQRLSRNQQLAHNAITKKKIPLASLFAKFNYKPAGHVEEEAREPVRPTSSSSASAVPSDVEMKDTPPTSPASLGQEIMKSNVPATLSAVESEAQEQDNDDELPSMEEVSTQLRSSPPTRLDKGKCEAIEEPTTESEILKKPLFTQRPIRVRLPKIADRKVSAMDDSDSDLEIVTARTPIKKKLESIFDRVPAKQSKESRPIHVLRMFANQISPRKQNTGPNKKPSITATELQVSLQQRARQQAAREREERLQALRDKGIIVQTAEEREKEMADVDDLLAKARREDEELMKREKAAAKKERKENGEVDPLGDSSDDEDWEEGKEDIPEEVSISGSDDEMEMASGEEGNSGEEDEDEGEDEQDESMAVDAEDAPSNPMFDNEADESDGDESEADLAINEENAEDGDVDEDEEDLEQELPVTQKHRRTRNANVISDDEDGDEEIDEQPSPLRSQFESPVQLHTKSPMAPNSVLRSATKTFIPGLTVAGPAGLGLTQIFAGTMDESQLDPFEASPTTQNQNETDSLNFLRQIPVPELPPFIPTMADDTQDAHMNSPSQLSYIPESQAMESETQCIELNFSQSQIHGFDSLVQDTQLSQFPEATQDVGFQHMTPIRGRFVDAPPSTVDTVMLDPTALPETTEETPIVKKKGKLRRRVEVASFSDDEDVADSTELNVEEDEFDITSNAFDVMRKASKKKIVVDQFSKKKSKAKEMVNEQAEESEDEYAGLGGASDDESGEEDAYAKEIIDDEGGKDVDESKLAAFFA